MAKPVAAHGSFRLRWKAARRAITTAATSASRWTYSTFRAVDSVQVFRKPIWSSTAIQLRSRRRWILALYRFTNSLRRWLLPRRSVLLGALVVAGLAFRELRRDPILIDSFD